MQQKLMSPLLGAANASNAQSGLPIMGDYTRSAHDGRFCRKAGVGLIRAERPLLTQSGALAAHATAPWGPAVSRYAGFFCAKGPVAAAPSRDTRLALISAYLG